MNLTIHRGTQEIGGSCVELKTGKARILIDFGMPLVEQDKDPFDPKIFENPIDAILVSHSHMDHYGLLGRIRKDIPVYMSQGAKELVEITDIFTPNKVGRLNTHIISNKKPFNIGDIKVTPYLVDHSGFDALAFLIEAEGKRLFYSGDFRGHGRKRGLFKAILRNPPKDIDCLLMEGTMLGRNDKSCEDEDEVEAKIRGILENSGNVTFLFASSQNIDRLVSAYRACLRTKKIFVIDIYTAYILDKANEISKGVPRFDWDNIRVNFSYNKRQADALVQKVSKKLLYLYNRKKIKVDEIRKDKRGVLFLSRYNSIFKRVVGAMGDVKGARVIYSMWEGYQKGTTFKEFCDSKGIAIDYVHTSGHAAIDDLKAFSDALKPRVLIPIHTFEAKRYSGLFKNVKLLKDGEPFLIN